MKTSTHKTAWLTGIAIFSMFFGAGNVIFPLKVGLLAGRNTPFAMGGLLLTAIGGPLLGLVGATLYKGDCYTFFSRAGRTLGLLFISTSLVLLGPFAVIPRCFVVAHTSFCALLGNIGLPIFSIFLGLAALVCCLRQNLILPLLGKVFSPILILSLLGIITIGVASGSPLQEAAYTPGISFMKGLEEGYDTMDLIAAIFFSSSIWTLLSLQMSNAKDKKIAGTAIYAGLIGGSLLGAIYIGLGFAAAFHAESLSGIAPEKLMASLAQQTLGPFWSQIANLAILVACFTTIVSLTQTIAGLCSRDFFPEKWTYKRCIAAISLLSAAFANLGFSTISTIIHPAIQICYPAIIVLTVFNLIYKLYGTRMIKRPVYGTLFSSTLLKSATFIGLFH